AATHARGIEQPLADLKRKRRPVLVIGGHLRLPAGMLGGTEGFGLGHGRFDHHAPATLWTGSNHIAEIVASKPEWLRPALWQSAGKCTTMRGAHLFAGANHGRHRRFYPHGSRHS